MRTIEEDMKLAEENQDLFGKEEFEQDFGTLTEMLCNPGISYEEARRIALDDLKEFKKEVRHEKTN